MRHRALLPGYRPGWGRSYPAYGPRRPRRPRPVENLKAVRSWRDRLLRRHPERPAERWSPGAYVEDWTP